MPDLSTQLSQLYKLQQFDTQIIAKRKIIRAIPKQLERLLSGFEQQSRVIRDKLSEITEIEKDQRSKNGEISVIDDQRKKYIQQQREVKTNKEYAALDRQISYVDDQQSKIEDEILELMEHHETLQEELKIQEEILDEKRQILDQRKSKLHDQQCKIENEIDGMLRTRTKIVVEIDPALVRQYQERMKRQRLGLVAPIESNSCGVCKLKIPPQLLNETKKADQTIHCPCANRLILFYPPSDENGDQES